MIQRWLELHPGKSCLLLGPRRAGKTTLLQHRLPGAAYATLDDFDILTAARRDPKGLIAELSTRSPIILDEVQRLPQLLIAVKYAIDQEGKTFFMTGSSALGLLNHGAETLAGRIRLMHCPTFCFGEEAGPPQQTLFEMPRGAIAMAAAARELESALRFGGFPEVVTSTGGEEKLEVLRGYRNTYFTRDLALLSNIESAEGLLAILNYLAVAIGSHVDVSNIARESGLSHPTVKKYLQVLVASDLVFKLYGYQFGPAKRYTKAAKYYFADNGVLTALGTPITEGQRLENFVVSEIEKRRKLGIVPAEQLFYYKSAAGAEIDLIIEHADQTTAVEVKSTRRPSSADLRHLRAFTQANSPVPRQGILLHRGDEAWDEANIRVLPVAALYGAG